MEEQRLGIREDPRHVHKAQLTAQRHPLRLAAGHVGAAQHVVLHEVVGAAVVGEYAAVLLRVKGLGDGQAGVDKLPRAAVPVEQHGGAVGELLGLQFPATLQRLGGQLLVGGHVHHAEVCHFIFIVHPTGQHPAVAQRDEGRQSRGLHAGQRLNGLIQKRLFPTAAGQCQQQAQRCQQRRACG